MDKIASFQLKVYNTILITTYIIYFLALFGITLVNPLLVNKLEKIIQIYVSSFLIYRFNPFKTIAYNELDRKIAFSAGVFLFMTTSINSLLKYYITNFKTGIKTDIKTDINKDF